MKLAAVLLTGPTGSGKSPLGKLLENTSLWGRRCCHFDFGAILRAVVARQSDGGFTPDEIRFLHRVLDEGDLLEVEHFPIAVRILKSFIAQRCVRPADLLLLNGLPRHLQQAQMLDEHLHILCVLELECDASTVVERLRRNSGGDRTERHNDTDELVARKLSLYEARTRPLLNYYRERGVRVLTIHVRVKTQPSEIVIQLERQWPQP